MAGANIIPGLDKLIEVTASGIGAVAGPMIARWTAHKRAEARLIEAKADADAKRIDAQAVADATVIKARGHVDAIQHISNAQREAPQLEDKMTFVEETTSRVKFQNHKRQSNIYNVVSMAAEELDGKEVEDHDVDHDWTARFFADAQDVTSEQMQWIWARILSGEVETPGRTSLHALSILRNMSQYDAREFANVARFVINNFVFCDDHYTSNVDDFPNYARILHLESHGLMVTGSFLTRRIDIVNVDAHKHKATIAHGNTAFVILANSRKSIELPIYYLTHAGRQIYDNLDTKLDEPYLSAFARYLKDKAEADLAIAPIIERCGTKFRHGQLTNVLSGRPYQG